MKVPCSIIFEESLGKTGLSVLQDILIAGSAKARDKHICNFERMNEGDIRNVAAYICWKPWGQDPLVDGR